MHYGVTVPTGSKPPPGPLTRAVAAILYARLGELRSSDRSFSQSALSKLNTGRPGYLSQPTLSNFFHGKKSIDLDQLSSLCSYLRVDVVEVIERAERELTVIPFPEATPLGEVAFEERYPFAEDTDDAYE